MSDKNGAYSRSTVPKAPSSDSREAWLRALGNTRDVTSSSSAAAAAHSRMFMDIRRKGTWSSSLRTSTRTLSSSNGSKKTASYNGSSSYSSSVYDTSKESTGGTQEKDRQGHCKNMRSVSLGDQSAHRAEVHKSSLVRGVDEGVITPPAEEEVTSNKDQIQGVAATLHDEEKAERALGSSMSQDCNHMEKHEAQSTQKKPQIEGEDTSVPSRRRTLPSRSAKDILDAIFRKYAPVVRPSAGTDVVSKMRGPSNNSTESESKRVIYGTHSDPSLKTSSSEETGNDASKRLNSGGPKGKCKMLKPQTHKSNSLLHLRNPKADSKDIDTNKTSRQKGQELRRPLEQVLGYSIKPLGQMMGGVNTWSWVRPKASPAAPANTGNDEIKATKQLAFTPPSTVERKPKVFMSPVSQNIGLPCNRRPADSNACTQKEDGIITKSSNVETEKVCFPKRAQSSRQDVPGPQMTRQHLQRYEAARVNIEPCLPEVVDQETMTSDPEVKVKNDRTTKSIVKKLVTLEGMYKELRDSERKWHQEFTRKEGEANYLLKENTRLHTKLQQFQSQCVCLSERDSTPPRKRKQTLSPFTSRSSTPPRHRKQVLSPSTYRRSRGWRGINLPKGQRMMRYCLCLC